MAVHIDVLSDFLHAIGFVHLPGLAVPEYIESEIVQDETPDGVDTYAIQRHPNLHAAAVIVLQSDHKALARFVGASAAVAVPMLGAPSSHLDSSDCQLLEQLGDQLLAQSGDEGMAAGRSLTLHEQVPAFVRRALGVAYGEIFMVDDYALHMSYLNGTSPFDYPMQSRYHKALLLFPTPQLLRNELEGVLQTNLAIRQAQVSLLDQQPPDGV